MIRVNTRYWVAFKGRGRFIHNHLVNYSQWQLFKEARNLEISAFLAKLPNHRQESTLDGLEQLVLCFQNV